MDLYTQSCHNRAAWRLMPLDKLCIRIRQAAVKDFLLISYNTLISCNIFSTNIILKPKKHKNPKLSPFRRAVVLITTFYPCIITTNTPPSTTSLYLIKHIIILHIILHMLFLSWMWYMFILKMNYKRIYFSESHVHPSKNVSD